ncbi:MAG: PEP-CTERM sorting domain-containing protein [Planctomycetes bacterium]|nr:PEP-CTERM sorting domain-containing protein [Planctomycetota bacterium]
MKVQILAICLVAAVAMVAAEASPVLLKDGNATLTIEPYAKAGVFSWCVDGTNHLAQQGFWFRFEGMDYEEPLSALGLIGTQLSDTNTIIDPCEDTLTAYYGDLCSFHVEVRYALQGGLAGSGTSDITEQIAFQNKTCNPLKLWFFQYADFDLRGTARDDTVWIQGGNTAIQTDPCHVMAETVVTPMPCRFEANCYPATLNSLCDYTITVLNNDPGPKTGDATWAFQWCLDIPAGGSALISKDKHLVPEPATMSLLALGAVSLLRKRRR